MESERQTRVHELTRAEALELLQLHSRVGRLGFIVDGQPLILPVNYLIPRQVIPVSARSRDRS